MGLASFIQWLDAVNFVPPSSAKDKIGSGTVAAVGLFANGDENKTPKHKTEQVRNQADSRSTASPYIYAG